MGRTETWRKGWILLLILLAGAGLAPERAWGQRAPDSAPTGTEADFFLGRWAIQELSADGVLVGRARTHVRRILDDTALQSDYFSLDRQGNTVFRGTTVRSFAPAIGQWIVHWSMANLPGYTYLQERWEDGELVGSGHGMDGQGEFQERYRYSDISDSTYTFRMERSYDGGQSWAQYANLRAVRPTG